jgi:Flp pilus assembly protein TadB
VTAATALFSALAVVLALPLRSDRRLEALIGGYGGQPAVRRQQHGSRPVAWWAAGPATVASWAVVGGVAGVAVAVAIGFLVHRALLVAAQRSAVAPDPALVSDAPLAFELLAACLAAGAPPRAALTGVAAAINGPLGQLLRTVADAAALGCPPEQAWAPLLEPQVPAPLRQAAAGFVRAHRSGAALAPALATIAAETRQARRVAAQAAARRAGVLAVGPLGVCFLPAFVLVGVVPLVAGLIGVVTL